MTFGFIAVTVQYSTFFFVRNQNKFSNTAFVQYYGLFEGVSKLFYNDYALLINAKETTMVELSPAYLDISQNKPGPTSFVLSATSSTPNKDVTCQVQVSMNVLSPNDPNVYQTNMQVNTLFEGYPDTQLTIPIDGPYVGANLQY